MPGEGSRSTTYCIVPYELAGELHDLLRDHFRGEPNIEVIVERRRWDRRQTGERRCPGPSDPPGGERRRIRNLEGRRVGERRAQLVPLPDRPPIPVMAQSLADRIVFVERVEPASERLEDLDTARVVTQIQAGDRDLFASLYLRYFDRVYGYLRLLLADTHEAEDVTQQVFINVMGAIPRYERRRQPFRAWLFRIARNEALSHLRHSNRVQVRDPDELEPEVAATSALDAPAAISGWPSDPELAMFFERLPDAQRQALALRYMLELTNEEIATVLDRSPVAIRKLQHRGLRSLEERLTANGHGRSSRSAMLVRVRRQPVVRARRFALATGYSRPPGLARRPSFQVR